MFDAAASRLDRIARALLPEHERSDRLVAARARFGGAVIGILVLLALVRVPMLLARGPRAQGAALLLCAILALVVPIVPRATGSFVYAAHSLVLLTLLPVVSLVHATGGSGSPALLALVVTPMIAVFLTGRRGGIGWSLVAAAVVCAYAIVDRLGGSPPILFPPDAWKLEKSIGAFLLTLAVLGLALSYERSRRIAEAEGLEAARQADERVAATELGHRESLHWLSRSLAHEANNTLAYVMADLAALDEQPTAGRSGSAARLGTERLRQIVRDVQTIAGDASGEPAGEDVAVDLGAVVAAVVEELAPLLRGLGIQVRSLPVTTPIFVRAVPATLARCIASSLIAFTPETDIEIALEAGARPAVVLTARRGALEARPLATEALRRTLDAFGGAIVMAGADEAATLRMELEPASPSLEAPKASGVRAAPGKATRPRVLVVDDEGPLLRVTARLLVDWDVTTAVSAHQALRTLASTRFDVVLCDFNMPEMRGDAFFAAAVELGLDPTRFVLMTGGDLGEVEAAFGQGRPEVLRKPYTRGEIVEALLRACATAERRDVC